MPAFSNLLMFKETYWNKNTCFSAEGLEQSILDVWGELSKLSVDA